MEEEKTTDKQTNGLTHNGILNIIKEKKPVFKIRRLKTFKFPTGTYEIDLNNTKEMDPLLSEVVKQKVMLQKLVNDKVKKPKNEDITKIANYDIVPLLEFYIRHHDPKHPPMGDERCSICIFEFYEDVDKLKFEELVDDLKEDKVDDIIQLEKCDGHYFHVGCIQTYLATHSSEFIKCPICCFIYGVMTGDQPQGKMKHSVEKNHHCDGFPGCGTITVQYNFPSGKLPSGKRYTGTNRTAFLPDNEDGREVLRLLQLSFERRLTFTIGTSVTTGQSDCVVWNGIHHKTNTAGGPAYFGYPDATYFNRVKLELAAKGVL